MNIFSRSTRFLDLNSAFLHCRRAAVSKGYIERRPLLLFFFAPYMAHTPRLAACGVRTSVERAGELLAAQLARAHGQAVQQRAAALAGVPG